MKEIIEAKRKLLEEAQHWCNILEELREIGYHFTPERKGEENETTEI